MEAPKVVYSSKPVLNKPSAVKKDTEKSGNTSSNDSKPDSIAGKKRDATEALGGSDTAGGQTTQGAAAGDIYDTQSAAGSSGGGGGSKKDNKKGKAQQKDKQSRFIRTAANDVWEDTSLSEWDPSKSANKC